MLHDSSIPVNRRGCQLLYQLTGGYVNRFVVGGDFFPNTPFASEGAIFVTQNGTTMTNTTYPSHIFYQGEIDRTISDGWIFTEGQGTNSNLLIAATNQYLGPIAFEANDAAMLIFSSADQLSGGALVQWMNTIPPQP
jgi:hypothetical protein